MDKKCGQLIVALDVPDFKTAKKLVDTLGKGVDIYKVGSQLFTACGPEMVRYLIKRGKRVFLDLKFYDIPSTAASAVVSAVSLLPKNYKKNGILMMTVHTQGGKRMLKAAVAANQEHAEKLNVPKSLIIGVTVLTSEETSADTRDVVLERARLAKDCGLDGVVASSQEAALIRQKFGRELIIVTPGIRPPGADAGDQKRITTPAEAIKNGSDFLIVGRPIVQARDPLKAAKEILKEMKQSIA